jgi:hypothetical protein
MMDEWWRGRYAEGRVRDLIELLAWNFTGASENNKKKRLKDSRCLDRVSIQAPPEYIINPLREALYNNWYNGRYI